MKKKLFAMVAMFALLASLLSGCRNASDDKDDADNNAQEGTQNGTQDNAQNDVQGENSQDGKTEVDRIRESIKIAASATPHAEILEKAEFILSGLGY